MADTALPTTGKPRPERIVTTTDDTLPDVLAPPASRARDAVVWGLPLVMMAKYLEVAEAGAVPFNRFFMNSAIASPGSAAIGPNIDTLNGRAWLDLDGGPVVIEVPDTADRYYSVQFQDMYMNSFAYVGRRTTGTRAGAFAVTSPGYRGTLPEGMAEIRATTSKVLCLVRTLVSGADDAANARAINGRFTIGLLGGYPGAQRPAEVSDGALDAFQPASRRTSRLLPHEEIAGSGAAFFEALDALTKRFPPLPADMPNFDRLAPLMTGRGAIDEAIARAATQDGIKAAQSGLIVRSANGWMRRDNVSPFIADPVQRAANNIYGPNTQVAEESVFFNLRKGPDGAPLTGTHRHRLFFAPDRLPPVDAFWSLTLYDRNYVLFDNPIDRYGITNHMDGLVYAPDGSLDIRIQPGPTGDPLHNWLPCPPDGFQLVLRTYQPRGPILDETYLPPPLEILGDA